VALVTANRTLNRNFNFTQRLIIHEQNAKVINGCQESCGYIEVLARDDDRKMPKGKVHRKQHSFLCTQHLREKNKNNFSSVTLDYFAKQLNLFFSLQKLCRHHRQHYFYIMIFH